MAISHAKPNEVISLPLGTVLGSSKTTTLVKTDDLELIRLVLPAGKEIPLHQAHGKITVQCLEGRITFTAESKTQELTPGQLLYLVGGEPHALKALDDSAVLVTLILPQSRNKPAKFDPVQEAGEESFPASDPPAI
jgi:quercetin dioxygenase-like cupin family protein